MEVEQAKTKLRHLETAVLTLVLEFQNQTGTMVDSIVLNKAYTLGVAQPGLLGVKIQAQL